MALGSFSLLLPRTRQRDERSVAVGASPSGRTTGMVGVGRGAEEHRPRGGGSLLAFQLDAVTGMLGSRLSMS